MTWSKSLVGSYLALVPSSTHMPRWTHYGWPKYYIIVHPWSRVRYHPTRWHMTLLNLGIPYVLYASVHFKCLFIWTQPTQVITDTGGGYQLGAPNFISDHSASFPSSILHSPLIAPPDLQLCQPFNHLVKPHMTSINRKGPITNRFQALIFYR
jgi:hypothetical protein